MRGMRRLALGVVFASFCTLPVFAVEPDDLPWDEIDRVLKEAPGAAPAPSSDSSAGEDILPGDRGEAVEAPGSDVDSDRLLTEHAAAPKPESEPAAAHLEPSQGNIPITSPAEVKIPTVSPVPAPAPVPTPAPVEAMKTPQATPVQTAAPTPPATPSASAPAASAATETTAAGEHLYLPIKRYFETKAVVTLKDYEEADRMALQQYYDAHMGQALWVDRSGFNAAAQNLIAEIKKADDWGLASNDYKIPSVAKAGAADIADDDLADAEVKLSLVALEYGRHARGFRIYNPPEQLSSYLDRQPQLIEPPKLIEGLASAPDKGAYLRALHPKHPQFERLRQKLLEFRASASKEEVEKIPDGPKLSPGKSHWQIALVRRRLNVPNPGMKPDGTAADDSYYDDALARAVTQFKEKNGLEPVNATITKDVRQALNADESVSEEALLANMEQWRWMPEDLGATHIEVNIPEFMVRVVKNNSIIHAERIVSGKVETQTPIFSDMMRTVVFQPSWNVPESIKFNELLPKLRAGGNPIERQGLAIKRNGRDIDVWDVDWNSADIRQYHIYQPPGDSNVLGVVKFLFPNKHAVYLHDTPSKGLFDEKIRTFSHGCMRVRNPVQLAEVIMAEDKGWSKEKVNDLVNDGPEDNDIALDHPIPVHVTYFTAWVDDDGKLKSFPDVYGHQKRIVLGLEGRWGEIVKNRDHLLPPDADDVPVARSREDWGDDDPEDRRGRPPRLTYRESAPPPGYKKNNSVGTMLQKVFGGGF